MTVNSYPPIPLDWVKVRNDLLHEILSYKEEKKRKKYFRRRNVPSSININIQIKKNLDVYLSLALSLALGSLGLLMWKDGSFTSESLIAGFFASVVSISSIFISLKQRGYDGEQSAGEKEEERNRIGDMMMQNTLDDFASFLSELLSKQQNEGEDSRKNNNSHDDEIKIKLSGTSLTDIYPVFRTQQQQNKCSKNSDENEDTDDEWHRVPKLLLVKGDYIALQVGDVAPATVTSIISPNISISSGERVSTAIADHISNLSPITTPPLSPTSSHHSTDERTIPEGSIDLLNYCNHVNIFILQETPLVEFLKRPSLSHSKKSPQIHRQIGVLRQFMLKIAIFVGFSSTLLMVVIYTTTRATSSIDITSKVTYYLYTIPLMAALSSLPMISPIFLFLLEIIGTSRILTNVHLFTTQHTLQLDDLDLSHDYNYVDIGNSSSLNNITFSDCLLILKSNQEKKKSVVTDYFISKPTKLFLQYCCATFRARCNKSYSSSYTDETSCKNRRLIPIPAANAFLLEKLGVITALSLIDDELACESQSTPQQLLIPTANGLKLLDLYPTPSPIDQFLMRSGGENDKDVNETDFYANTKSKRSRNISFGSLSEYYCHSDDSEKDSLIMEYDSFIRGRNIAAANQTYIHQSSVSSPLYHVAMKGIIESVVLEQQKRWLTQKGSYYKEDEEGATKMKNINEVIMRTILHNNNVNDIHKNNCEVQFEDPTWWQFLPSLKCIGLACLLSDHDDSSFDEKTHGTSNNHRNFLSNTSINMTMSGHRQSYEKEAANEQNKVSTLPMSTSFVCLKTLNKKSASITTTSSFKKSYHGEIPKVGTEGSSSISLPDSIVARAQKSLVQHLCNDHRKSRPQLHSLAKCIGFSTSSFNNDLESFKEHRRLHIISKKILEEKMELHTHALGLQEARIWNTLKTHASSVIIRNTGLKANNNSRATNMSSTNLNHDTSTTTPSYQLLTVGDPKVVTSLCADSWQGENTTITPLTSNDKQLLIETCDNWALADLDVAAFSYAPVPYTQEQRIGRTKSSSGNKSNTYLIHDDTNDNLIDDDASYHHTDITDKNKDFSSTNELSSPNNVSTPLSSSGDWSLVKNQILLGVLGSAVSPRKEISQLISECQDAGVRFVYFSPRNMRRTKEVASQMGIDVAWNCAISLRELSGGEKRDPHRMKSGYGDWDVKAKLPHGINAVKAHLEEVDNVPLLVSLYTDVDEDTTTEMVQIFQKYHDTVLSLGLSHRSRNERTFSNADLSIGVDVLSEEINKSINSYYVYSHSSSKNNEKNIKLNTNALLPSEVEFASSVISHSCVFNLKGSISTTFIPKIISHGREALEATIASGLFFMNGCFSMTFLIVFSSLVTVCSPSAHMVYISPLGCIFYLQILLPFIGIIISMSEADKESMNRVPCKNDENIVFGQETYRRLCTYQIVRSFPPVFFAIILYLISYGELFLAYEKKQKKDHDQNYNFDKWCGSNSIEKINNWYSLLLYCHYDASSPTYVGPASSFASSLTLAYMAFCIVISSAGFVFRTQSIFSSGSPLSFIARGRWHSSSKTWLKGSMFSLILIALYVIFTLERPFSTSILPWYFYFIFFMSPIVCLLFGEYIKKRDRKHETRAVRLRRLQFETKLGQWSPK